MLASETDVLIARLTRMTRLLVVAVTLAVLGGLELPVLVANHGAYPHRGPQFLAFGLFTAVALTEVGNALTGRTWGRWRWPLCALVLAASVAATATVRPDDLLGIEHWSFGAVGWVLVLLTYGEPIPAFLGLLAVHYALTIGQVVPAGTAAPTLAGALNQTMLAAVFQCGACVLTAGLHRAAVTAANAWSAGEQARTGAEVASRLHSDRVARYRELSTTTVPLLAGLAAGTLDPAADDVRRSCAIEAARMRRLFADTAAVPDPLVHHLLACLDLAERRGVAVTFAVRGDAVPVPRAVRLALTEAAAAALATARHKARVTLVRADATITVSVVSDAVDELTAAVSRTDLAVAGVTASTVVHEGQVRVASVWKEPPRRDARIAAGRTPRKAGPG
jgi:hypothetical protein